MYLDGSRRISSSRDTVTRNKGSGNAARIGTAGDLKAHDNISRTRHMPVAEAVASAVEVAHELGVLESEAREFLIAQGIATAEAFLSTESATMADALVEWRESKQPVSFIYAQYLINGWKRSLRERQSSSSGQPLAELDAELKMLSTLARHFLSSPGITTADAFLSTDTNTTANALKQWRKRCDSSECSIRAAGQSLHYFMEKNFA
jgi:hypothetical protein